MAITIIDTGFKLDPNNPSVQRANRELRAAFERAFWWPIQAIALAIKNKELEEELARLKEPANG